MDSSTFDGIWLWLVSVDGQTWAAWFQGLGTLAGIFCAWMIGNAQWRRHLQVEAKLDQDSVLAVCVLIFRAKEFIDVAAKNQSAYPPSYPTKTAVRSLAVIAEKLESFDFIKRPSLELVKCSLASANAVHKFLEGVEMSHVNQTYHPIERIRSYALELGTYGQVLLDKYDIEDRRSVARDPTDG